MKWCNVSSVGTETLADVQQTSPELERAGQIVRDRMRALRLNREEAIRSVRLARETWRKVERGFHVSDESYYKVERALGWPEGTMRQIIDGGDAPEDNGGTLPPQVTVYERDVANGDLKALLLALGDADEATQQMMIETAMVAYRVAKRRDQRP